MGLKLTLSLSQQRKPEQKKLKALRLHPPIPQVGEATSNEIHCRLNLPKDQVCRKNQIITALCWHFEKTLGIPKLFAQQKYAPYLQMLSASWPHQGWLLVRFLGSDEGLSSPLLPFPPVSLWYFHDKNQERLLPWNLRGCALSLCWVLCRCLFPFVP